MTYAGRGLAKPGVNAREHAIIYTGLSCPGLSVWEQSVVDTTLLAPICVVPTTHDGKLHPLSRVNFAKMYTVEFDVQVYDFGLVHKDCRDTFWSNYERVQAAYHESEKPRSVKPKSELVPETEFSTPDQPGTDEDERLGRKAHGFMLIEHSNCSEPYYSRDHTAGESFQVTALYDKGASHNIITE